MRELVPPTHRAPLAKKLVYRTTTHVAATATAAFDRRLGAGGRAALGAGWRGARRAATWMRTGLPKVDGALALLLYTTATALFSLALALQWPAAATGGWLSEDWAAGAPLWRDGNATDAAPPVSA